MKTPHTFRPDRRTLLAQSLALAAAGIWAPAAFAASPNDARAIWPTRAVRLIVGFPPGSSPDITARTLAEPLSQALGQPVIVENRPGASGNIGADIVAKAADDHTLGILINGNLTSAKQLYSKLPYDPAKDFSLISLLAVAPLVLVAPANQPDGAAFFEAARAGGEQWNFGSVGNGSVAHLGMELLKSRDSRVRAVHIPYPGNPQVVTALLAGQIQMALVPPALALPQVRAGKLKAIGLTSGRSTLVPDVPPLADAGIKNFNLEVWNALLGPASLSKAAQTRLSEVVPGIVRDPAMRQRLYAQGWQAVGTSPDGLQARIRDESKILGDIITARGIRIE